MTSRSANGRARSGPSDHRGARAASTGFTLIEVLVALAIVAVSLAAGSRAASSVVDTSQRLSGVMLAQWCADNELTELRLTNTFPPVGVTPFSCTEAGREFKGAIKAQVTPNPSFRRVDAVISDTDDRELLTIATVMSRSQ
jgi:general secretion pathway protein I